MNFLAGVQRLHRETGRSNAVPTALVGATTADQRLFDWYADAWRAIQSERSDWRWMRATLDATLTIDLQTYTGTALGATSFGRWRAQDDRYCPLVYVSGSINTAAPVKFLQLDEFRRRWVYHSGGSSWPIEWSIDEDDQLLLGPPPSVAYKLRIDYWKEPIELDADADVPDLPDRFQLMPMWGALIEAAKYDAAPDVLQRATDNYATMKEALLLDQATNRPYL